MGLSHRKAHCFWFVMSDIIRIIERFGLFLRLVDYESLLLTSIIDLLILGGPHPVGECVCLAHDIHLRLQLNVANVL